MSKIKTEEILTNFLRNPEAEVVTLKWEWWVWKTYFWNDFLKRIKTDSQLQFKKYSYVSLFGIWSIEELRQLIYKNQINLEEIWCNITFSLDEENLSNIGTVIKNKAKSVSWYSKVIWWISGIIDWVPEGLGWDTVKRYNPVQILVGVFSFLKTRECLICIDDFERTKLDKKGILWVVSELKEQRKCKVVLIFNDNKLKDEDKQSYTEFREKVIDIEMEFSPTIEECVSIIFPDYKSKESYESTLFEYINILGIKNLRILQKIKRTYDLLSVHLKELHPWVTKLALRTICLFTLSYYSSHESNKKDETGNDSGKPNKNIFWYYVYKQERKIIEPIIPPPSYLYNLEYLWHLFDEKDADSIEASWDSFLSRYGYMSSDDFDKAIFRVIERWYLIEEDFLKYAQLAHEKCELWDAGDLYKNAWENYYHDWFYDNKDDFIEALKKAFVEWWEFLDGSQLNSAVYIMRELDANDIANEIIGIYVDKHHSDRSIYSVSDIQFHSSVQLDAEVKRRFIEKYNQMGTIRDLKWVLDYIIERNYSYWNEEEAILFKATEEDIYKLLKETKWRQNHNYRSILLKYRKVVNPSDEWKELTESTLNALKRIGDECLINNVRMKSYNLF